MSIPMIARLLARIAREKCGKELNPGVTGEGLAFLGYDETDIANLRDFMGEHALLEEHIQIHETECMDEMPDITCDELMPVQLAKLDSEELEELSKCESKWILHAAALDTSKWGNPGIMEIVLEKGDQFCRRAIARSEYPNIRAKVAELGYCIDKLIEDADEKVFEAAEAYLNDCDLTYDQWEERFPERLAYPPGTPAIEMPHTDARAKAEQMSAKKVAEEAKGSSKALNDHAAKAVSRCHQSR
ncbi:MAG: hypothetical protein HFJ65_08460 [Eggerthellaceae bacterium]|nr:hypothetical protein [Eggerthellaceae bacterium]